MSQSVSEPLGELEHVAERMRQMLDQTFGGFGQATASVDMSAWTPLVDIEEQDDDYVIEADLPGVKRGDLNIELIGNELTITGELVERQRKGIIRRRTRRAGRFEYRVILPHEVDPDGIEASLEEGVLTVRVPMSEPARRRQIEVTSP